MLDFMKTLIIHPENKEQLAALKSFLKAFNISFEERPSDYNPEFIAKIKDGLEQIKKGETRVVNVDNL
jgi:hypothetical protein